MITALREALARSLEGHQIRAAKEQAWDRFTNGELLAAADEAGFDVLLTTDKNIRCQQNLPGRKIAVVVLSKARWRLIRLAIPQILAAVNAAKPGTFAEVEIPD